MQCDSPTQEVAGSTVPNVGVFGGAYYGQDGSVRQPPNVRICTGVLVACDTVITSAACTFTSRMYAQPGERMKISFANTGAIADGRVTGGGAEVVFFDPFETVEHPLYDRGGTAPHEFDMSYGVGLIRLAEPVAIAPAGLAQVIPATPVAGLLAAGYGAGLGSLDCVPDGERRAYLTEEIVHHTPASTQPRPPDGPRFVYSAPIWHEDVRVDPSCRLLNEDAGGPLFADAAGRELLGVAVHALHSILDPVDCPRSLENGWADLSLAAGWISEQIGAHDTDADGVPDTCDCGFGDNSVTCSAGTEHEGDPQVCQVCGCDDSDSDGDGVCDSEDPCLNVLSTQTVNTNVVSERFHTPEKIWPDVCDPVPSPAAAPIVQESLVEDLGCPNVHCWKVIRRLRNEIEVTPVQSNPSPELAPSPFQPVIQPRGVTTHPRFCPSNGGGPECISFTAVDDRRLTDAATRDVELAEHPYHRVRFSYQAAPGIPPLVSLFSALIPSYPMPLDYTNQHAFSGTNVYSARWHHQADFDFWQGEGQEFIRIAPPATSDGVGSAASLAGIFWLHADTQLGAVEGSTGLHGDQLANSHTYLQPEQREVVLAKLLNVFNLDLVYMPDPGPLGADVTARPTTWADRGPGEARYADFDAASRTVGFLTARGELVDVTSSVGAGLMTSLATSGARVARLAEVASYSRANTTTAVVLSSDGTVILDRVTQRADGTLGGGGDDLGVACGPGTVLVECEAGVRCAVACDGIVGNDPAASAEEDSSCRLVAGPEDEGLTDESDYTCQHLGDPPAPCPPGQLACASSCFVPCDGDVGCAPNGQFSDEQPDLCGSTAGGPGGEGTEPGEGGGLAVPGLPEPREGYVATYSRTLDRVFLAGGANPEGAHAGDLWVGPPRGHFLQMAPAGTFGQVLGLAYLPRARAIFVLDERPGSAGRARAHLTRVEAATGARTALGSWPRAGLFEELHLLADKEGSLLIAGSSRRRDRHVLVRLDPASRRVTGIFPGPHAFASVPVVDEAGYLLVTQRRSGKLIYRHERELGRAGGCRWAELGWHL